MKIKPPTKITVVVVVAAVELLEFDTPAEQTTDEYKDYFIKCKVKGNAMPTFMWSYKNQTIKDKTKSEKYSVEEGGLLVRNVTHLDAGKYTCRAFETTSKSSVSGEKEINLKVRHKPVFKTHMEGDPVEMYVFKSDSISLNCRNSAEPPANMTWSFEDASFLNPYEDYMVTFTEVKKLGLYSCTARNTLGKVTRRFRLIEGFKPKTPSGLAVGEIGENFIKLKVDAGDPADNLIGYRVEYVTKAVEPGTRKTYESFDMINFNTTTGPFALENLMPDTEYMTKILARNRAGNSNYTDTMVVRTKPLVVITGAAQPSSGGLVLHRFLLLSAAAYVIASLLGQ
ncbi:Fibronectin type III,Immunoglobulin subtype,Immunoglobulin-like domain,Immunoglobulin-like [Cinara cedri]|uniref:Fibronectin type III,Immunoglobulin subtype,Immunoglobulin-like domain,Immunoglobulin-like n=1 Tax=Cinara cedri TaxID=506608 RepID=A0A5E4NEB8_9HEMI|nr:Fibronectin type III,Immunoglobulin subtype,Immunoglobulin-like domain,Immunoglobulin-like [Cinara cedri]